METVRRHFRLRPKITGIVITIFFVFIALSSAHAYIYSIDDVAPFIDSYGDTTVFVALTVGNVLSSGYVFVGEGSTLTTLGGAFIGNLALGIMEVNGMWSDDSFINIGHSSSGEGELTINPTGALNGNRVTFGALADSIGSANVLGALNSTERLVVGRYGTGNLIIKSGGAVNSSISDWMNSSVIGLYSGSDGEVIVTGRGSTWTNNGPIRVGSQGIGNLIIRTGGTVISDAVYGAPGSLVGLDPGSEGTVTVTGAGSTWTNNGYLSVGVRGKGSLTIADGGQVISDYVSIGFDPSVWFDCSTGCEGTVTVTGEGSILKTTENYFSQIGPSDGDKGSLTIQNGGKVQVRALLVGRDEGSEGVLVVENATIEIDSTLGIGYNNLGQIGGKGTVWLVNGTVIASNTRIGANGKLVGTGAITGNVYLEDGGTLSPGLSPGQMIIDGDFNLTNGLLELETDSPSLKDELLVSGNVHIGLDAIFNIVLARLS